MNTRGQYGNGTSRVGQIQQATPIYVERAPSSAWSWIMGTITIVGTIGSVLWTRHQSQQIEQLYKKAGLPYQSFPESLRQRVGTSLHDLAERARPKKRQLLTRDPDTKWRQR